MLDAILGGLWLVVQWPGIGYLVLGVPSTAASQATIIDGYTLAMKGEADRAFGAAFTVSAIGGVLGAIALAVFVPIAKR